MATKRARVKLEEVEIENNYFKPQGKLEFVSSGCTILDCCLGGGFALGRVANIVGDRSTAKTAIATEVVINFLRQYPHGSAFYRETEAAFDLEYSKSMGMPIDRVNFGDPDKPITTVEEFAKELADFIKKQIASGLPGIYVLDSLDALSDEAEMERNIGEGTFGLAKAKAMSILFRTIARKLDQTKILLLIISQVRENINAVAFGEKYRRSGGKALDFFSSQIMWLAHAGTLKRSIGKVERPYGIEIKAKIRKNKVGNPLRECKMEFHFGYGIEDLLASIFWLKDVNKLDSIDVTDLKQYVDSLVKMNDQQYKEEQQRVSGVVKTVWKEIEDRFAPARKKYDL